ncbi:hypothetical protein BH20ACT23_BH20ACT23_10190 [soil metagenome]
MNVDVQARPAPLFESDSADQLAEELDRANSLLAEERVVPSHVADLMEHLGDRADRTSSMDVGHVDPYLVVAFQRGLIGALRAVDLPDESQRRRQLRVSIERMRQALRDFAEEVPINEARSAKEIARWLVEVLDVPVARVAGLLDVSPRTYQRWLSPTETAKPHGDDALRVRVAARIANHLRHVFTGPGVIRWFERPHPQLKGEAPIQLLRETEHLNELVNLAAASRSSAAT